MNDREQFTILDAMTVVSFMIGLANYGENVDQSAMSKTVQAAVDYSSEYIQMLQDKYHEEYKEKCKTIGVDIC